jgi:hypothetical protein
MPELVKGNYVENISFVAFQLSEDSKTLQIKEINDLFNIFMGCL